MSLRVVQYAGHFYFIGSSDRVQGFRGTPYLGPKVHRWPGALKSPSSHSDWRFSSFNPHFTSGPHLWREPRRTRGPLGTSGTRGGVHPPNRPPRKTENSCSCNGGSLHVGKPQRCFRGRPSPPSPLSVETETRDESVERDEVPVVRDSMERTPGMGGGSFMIDLKTREDF